MQGLKACENGHPAYQHPKRPLAPFDHRIDKFSALVIYLSLLGLAEDQNLWRKYHDDNLIFKKEDFVNPTSSLLFRRLKNTGGEVEKLTEQLIRACSLEPENAPSISDLVAVKQSKLPTWMRSQPEVQVEIKTRAVQQPPLSSTGSSWSPWVSSGSSGTTTSSSSAQPTPTSGAPIQGTQSPIQTWALSQSQYWEMVLKASFANAFAVFFTGLFFFWLWVPLLQGLLPALGIVSSKKAPADAVFIAYVAGCCVIGFIRARREVQDQMKAQQTPSRGTSSTSTVRLRPQLPTSPPPSPTPACPVVASRIRTKYHRPRCRWARKIDPRNKMSFSSATDARNAGLRPCGECHPGW